MPIICPSCGAENPDYADYCNLCMSTVGFDCAEYTVSAANDEGFSSKYPSSFSDDAPVIHRDPDDVQPSAPPVDIGMYGTRSGEHTPDTSSPAGANPVDVGQYGVRSGETPHQPAPLAGDYGHESHTASHRAVKREARRLRKERRRG